MVDFEDSDGLVYVVGTQGEPITKERLLSLFNMVLKDPGALGLQIDMDQVKYLKMMLEEKP